MPVLKQKGCNARICRAFDNALYLPLTSCSRYVLFSDCHRGSGNTNDNFLKNEFIYLAALNYYYQKRFIYLELGDGDELWENRSMEEIKEAHVHCFEMLQLFQMKKRFYSLYGNHDMEKKENPEGFPFYESFILKDMHGQKDIYITHGHQPELLNSTFWKLARFLVRYLWKPLEYLGIPDPTSAAQNNTRKAYSEKRLTKWAISQNHLLITGHTHHPMIGTPASPYCNTGSCVHPASITCIEIEKRCLTLVKWSMQARMDMSLYAKREVLGKTVCIDVYAGNRRCEK